MGFLNTIVEYEGVVVDVRPRYWAAHRAALEQVGCRGPEESEFWRLWRIGAPAAQFVRHAKPEQVAQYVRFREERIDNVELMSLDQAPDDAAVNLRLLKQMGTCHLVSLSRNRDGLNATLDRLDLWMYFESKQLLPADRERRVEAIKKIAGTTRITMAIASSVAFAYAAGEAGCRVVGMTTGTSFPKFLRQVGVDAFFDSLDALTDALSRHDPELQRMGIF